MEQIQGESRRVTGEVVAGGKDLPVATRGSGAKKEINRRSCDASRPALVVDAGGFFVIVNVQGRFVERAQLVAQLPEGGFAANARKQFLADGSELSATIPDEFPQRSGETLLARV
jgi:hypothetical protein